MEMTRTDLPANTYSLTGCNWELTLRCSLNCLHCGSRAGKARLNELRLEECLSVADELTALGCKSLTMIGGEVFLYKGWEILSKHLKDKDIAVNIVTNGYRMGTAEIEQIKRAELTNVGISIDGMEANHNRVRGRKDAFQRVRNTLELLNKEGIRTSVVTTLMRFNCDDLEELFAFLVEHHVEIWQLQLANPMGNMAGREDFVVRPEQVRQVIAFIRSKSRDRRMDVIAADNIGYFDKNETYIRGSSSPIGCWGGCSAGISSIFIDSAGNVKGCGALCSDAFIEGNVRNTSLAEVWYNEDNFAYNRKFTTGMLAGKCKGCAFGEACKGGCRASNYFATKNLYSNAFCSRKSHRAATQIGRPQGYPLQG